MGDSLRILREIEPDSVDAVITDPPYSSGGAFRGDRMGSTRDKYLQSGEIKSDYAKRNFAGDNMDARAWTSWSCEWLRLALEATKPGGVVAVFTDWRQLPALTDAIQWAGWVWRGLLSWDKKNARPQPGRPKQQCEFIVWGSKGALDVKRNAPFMPGVFSYMPPTGEKRVHQTEKPLELMTALVEICEVGGLVLDPFAGSGSTLLAAAVTGRRYIGIELDAEYHAIAEKRLQEESAQVTFEAAEVDPACEQVIFEAQ